jgi:opacity protein-like surface antigen
MSKRIAKYMLLIAFLHFSSAVSAQMDSCLTYLRDANLQYEDGWYDESISLLKKSLSDCDLSKDEQIETRKVLILNYLAIDNIEKAEESTAAIMKLDPNYEVDKAKEPAEVILLFQKYKPTAYVKILALGGSNFSVVDASETYSISTDNSEEDLSNYKSKPGFQFGLALEYRTYKNFWIQTGAWYRQVSYSNELHNIQDRTINYSEDLGFLDVPVQVKYYLSENKIQPYVEAGLNLSFLSNSLGELSRDDVKDIVNRTDQRNQFQLGYSAGAGLSYNLKNLSFQAGIKYTNTPSQLNKDGSRYDNLDLVFKYYYLDNDIALDNLQLNAGISFNLIYKNIAPSATRL